jgi:hypothetical protein
MIESFCLLAIKLCAKWQQKLLRPNLPVISPVRFWPGQIRVSWYEILKKISKNILQYFDWLGKLTALILETIVRVFCGFLLLFLLLP